MSEGKSKRLKVYKGYHYRNCKPHPLIRLKGVYLAKAGFRIGDVVTVQLSEGQIHIQKRGDKQAL